MAIVNLGLQAIAIARAEMPKEMEEAERCNSLKVLRAVASRNSEFQGACLDAIAPVKRLLTDIALRPKRKSFKCSLQLYLLKSVTSGLPCSQLTLISL